MSRIDITPPERATDELLAAYRRVAGARGSVANILRISSVNPTVMMAHLDLYRPLMFGRSPLSRAEREMAAVVVSRLNGCHY